MKLFNTSRTFLAKYGIRALVVTALTISVVSTVYFYEHGAPGHAKFSVSKNGAFTLSGGQIADITTLAGFAPRALVIQPGNNTSAISVGAGLTLQAGNGSGSKASTGGLLTLKGGDATGGARTGGGVSIDSGSGTIGGNIIIGGTNAATVAIGRTGQALQLKSLTRAVANGVLYIKDANGTVEETAASTGAQCLQTLGAGFIPSWGACSSTPTLQNVFDTASGNTITADGTSLMLTQQGTAPALVINDTNAATNTAIDIQSGGVSKFTISELGNITSSNFNTTATGINATAIGATTPNTGAFTTVNGLTLTAGATGFSIAGGTTSKTLTVSNTLTLAGTDSSTLNIGAGGTLGSNAFSSTAFAPIASPTFTGTVTIPTPFTLGAISVTSTGTQLNYLNAATGTTGTTSTNLVFSTSPVLVTPDLGTPSALVGTNITGTAAGLSVGTATNLAGGLGGQIPYQSAAGTTAMLANGSAGQVLTSAGTTLAPTWTTATTGTVTSVDTAAANNGVTATWATTTTTPRLTIGLSDITPTTVNGLTLTAGGTGFSIAGGTTSKTLTVSNTLTLAGTDASTLNIGAGGTLGSNAFSSTAFAPIASPTFTGTVTIPTPFTLGAISVTSTGTQLNYLNAATGTTGTTSTNLVFSTSPVLVTPDLGTPSALVGTNITGTAAGLSVGTATNLAGGLGGQIPYQSAAGTTAMLANGSAGQVLTSAGTTLAPTWTTATTGTVTSVDTAAANNGVTATWATTTTTPRLTIGLSAITPTTVNGLTLTAGGIGFSIAGGTTSKTLTVSNDTTLATNAITLGGGEVITFSAANAVSLLTTGATSVTLPTSGTLVSSVTTGNGVSAVNTAGALAFTLGAITPTTVNASGLITASDGLTLTTGALNLTATSGALALSGLSASSINTGANALTITSSNFNTTATGINSTAIGATTASSGKFTTLTSTGVTDLANAGASAVTIATTGTGTVTIGNATGTFALTSSGGLNVTTGGALTGVASLDTITTSATALTFAAGGTVAATGANALNLTGGAASTWSIGANNLTVTSNNFNVTTPSTNFGGLTESGAFAYTTSSLDEEFNNNNRLTPLATDGSLNGDTGAFNFDTITSPATTYSTPLSAVGGVGRLSFPATSGAGAVFMLGRASGSGNGIYLKANLPVVMMKIKPSLNASTEDTIWGLMATSAAASGTDGAAPSSGIYFSSEDGTSWVGVVRNGGVNVGTTSCVGTISTSQYSVGKIVVESATSVHFYMDYDASDGINFTDCGTVAGANPTAALTIGLMNTHTVALASTIDIDYIRSWQDDAPVLSSIGQPSAEPVATPDPTSSSSSPLKIDSAPTSFDGRAALADLMAASENIQNDPSQQLDTGLMVASQGIVTPSVTTDMLAVNTIKPSTGTDINLELGQDGRFVVKNPAGGEAIVFDASGNAKFTGTITADKIKANQVEGLTAPSSGLVASQNSNSPSPTGLTQLGDITINSGTITLGLTVNGTLFASGGLKVAGPAEFNGTSIFNNLATFNDKAIFAGDVSFLGRAVFSSDSGGFATVHSGDQQVHVAFTKPYGNLPVVTLSVKNGQFVTYAYKDLANDGFTIVLKDPAVADVEFAWTALPVQSQ